MAGVQLEGSVVLVLLSWTLCCQESGPEPHSWRRTRTGQLGRRTQGAELSENPGGILDSEPK